MTIEVFLQRLADRGLSLTVRDGHKLVLSGEKARGSEGIYQYIRLHRDELVSALNDQAQAVLCNVVDRREVTQALCFACGQQVDEQDETAWRIAPDGTLFCRACYDARHIALLSDQEDITQLVSAWQQQPCSACGGHDWLVDPWIDTPGLPRRTSGFLICPCIVEMRKLKDQPRPAMATQLEPIKARPQWAA